MLDSKSLASIPLRPANLAPPAPVFPWPGSHTSAMFLSFDVDAESAWTGKDPSHAERLVTMSFGGFEARVGTPKLLELLEQLGLRATFFITGWSVEAHPAMAESILRAGHEIGHHGFHHLTPDPHDPFIEEELERGFEVLQRRLGVTPKGYRAPSGEFCEELRAAFERAGVDRTKPIVTTCGSGLTAAILMLALDEIGASDVALYDGSWTEWGGRPEAPVVTG